ncbi:hypothetical protein [Pseudonocardia sp. MH-G8]|uniref:hypothetical protein n=1 Tax=Pseudonocardia sp. MH-G8 TaxID=1854588 RepID=UPI000BA0F483|nr:hypothetical protein [Pseudonocardia sp. MH-G8]OZM77198.1 hypothetical protein CFP66_36850 [Pseudonocardia sp. MH-G8]
MNPVAENGHLPPAARRVGPWLMWFAVLGASVAWALHLFVAWGVVELACASGRDTVLGLPLRGLVLVATVVPLLVALAATWTSWRLRRRIAQSDTDDRRLQRAGFLAGVGLALSLLAVATIVFGGAALLVLEPCAT